MLTIFIRGIILYCILVLAMRAMGKRQLGQFQPYEFVMVMLIANLVASPMSDVATPLFHGLLPVAALYIVHGIIKLISMKSDKFRAVISGKPSLIISDGVLKQDELKRLALSLSDVLEGIRIAGILDPAEVGTAIMEANGSITAFPKSGERSPKASEMGVEPGYEGMPMVLVMDGRVQQCNMQTAGLSEPWLKGELSSMSYTLHDIFLLSIDTQGRLMLQDRRGNVRQYQALKPDGVKW